MADPIVRSIDWRRVREPDSQRAYTLLRIETNTGVTGFGECGPVPQSEMQGISILEKPATAIEPIRKELAAQPRVRAAVDMALLDISAKIAGVPVYQLLGGPTRNKARALARIGGATESALEAEMRSGMAAGYRAFAVPLPEIKTEIMRQDAFVKSAASPAGVAANRRRERTRFRPRCGGGAHPRAGGQRGGGHRADAPALDR